MFKQFTFHLSKRDILFPDHILLYQEKYFPEFQTMYLHLSFLPENQKMSDYHPDHIPRSLQ